MGHFISKEDVSTDPKKVDALLKWLMPKTIKQLIGFLRLTRYYRRFIQNYRRLAQPFTNFCKASGNIKWSEEVELAFTALKEAMTATPMLALLDFSQTFVIETDASGNGIGVVLIQHGHPIAFISKALFEKHQKLSTYDKEMFAILFIVKKWHHFLIGRHFIIRTDYKPFKHLLG